MAVTVEEYIPGVHEKPHLTVTSDKFNHKFVIKPTIDGYVFYHITVNKGNVPKELQGYYSTMKAALADLERYERIAQPSKTVQRDTKAKARKAEKEQIEA